jgi:hypothetical protein
MAAAVTWAMGVGLETPAQDVFRTMQLWWGKSQPTTARAHRTRGSGAPPTELGFKQYVVNWASMAHAELFQSREPPSSADVPYERLVLFEDVKGTAIPWTLSQLFEEIVSCMVGDRYDAAVRLRELLGGKALRCAEAPTNAREAFRVRLESWHKTLLAQNAAWIESHVVAGERGLRFPGAAPPSTDRFVVPSAEELTVDRCEWCIAKFTLLDSEREVDRERNDRDERSELELEIRSDHSALHVRLEAKSVRIDCPFCAELLVALEDEKSDLENAGLDKLASGVRVVHDSLHVHVESCSLESCEAHILSASRLLAGDVLRCSDAGTSAALLDDRLARVLESLDRVHAAG